MTTSGDAAAAAVSSAGCERSASSGPRRQVSKEKCAESLVRHCDWLTCVLKFFTTADVVIVVVLAVLIAMAALA